MQTITPERDRKNQLLIAKVFTWHSAEHRAELLSHGSPEDRASFVKAQHKKMLIVLAGVVIVFGAIYLKPRKPAPPLPAPILTSAGQVVGLELHETTFSTSTTVVTTTGTYQVRGGVSASKGDPAQLKQEKVPTGILSALCLDSKIKAGCYDLL